MIYYSVQFRDGGWKEFYSTPSLTLAKWCERKMKDDAFTKGYGLETRIIKVEINDDYDHR